MKIESKFNIGDVVYVCQDNSKHERESCKTCDGMGFVTIKEKTFCCPECHGNKLTYTKLVKNYVPEKRTIKRIKASVSENNGNIKIHIGYETKTHGKRDRRVAEFRNIIFATLEEAEARCKELNGTDHRTETNN